MKKSLQILSLLICLSLVSLFVIYCNKKNKSEVKNGFTRSFSKRQVRLVHKVSIENSQYAFIDNTRDGFSLYEFKKPYHIVEFSADLKRRKDYLLPDPSKYHKIDGLNSVTFIGNLKFILVGRASKAYKIDEASNKVDSSTLDSLYFYQSVAISPNSFVYISLANYKGERRSSLVKTSWGGEHLNKYIPEKQFDGMLSTDGQFRYSNSSGLLAFMFYYRGEIICLDTNLKVRYKAKTIDTITHANIQLKEVGNKTKKIAMPSEVVNQNIYLTEDKMFIQSKMKSDLESQDAFDGSVVIDTYALKDGKYLYSFYLPKLERKKLHTFSVYKNNLIALYENNLAIFRIPEQ